MTTTYDWRALTLVQPWGTALIHLGKDVENRPWAPPSSLVGKRFAVHAGKRVDRGDSWGLLHELDGLDLATVPTGALLGTVELVGYIGPLCNGAAAPGDWPLTLRALESRWRAPTAKWMWVVRDPRPLPEPIACKGALGLWRVPEPLARQLDGLGGASCC